MNCPTFPPKRATSLLGRISESTFSTQYCRTYSMPSAVPSMASTVLALKPSRDSSIMPAEREKANCAMISVVSALKASYASTLLLAAPLPPPLPPRRRIFRSISSYLSWMRPSSLKMPARENMGFIILRRARCSCGSYCPKSVSPELKAS